MNIRGIGIAILTTLMVSLVGAQGMAQTEQSTQEAPASTEVALEPIPEAWAKAFGAMRADPQPKKLTRDSHYWVSDEQRHDLFREAISNSGGVFIGLGTDQNYLMAAWAKPEVLVPLDFDEMVVFIHYAFEVVFLNAENPKRFMQMWSKNEQKSTMDLIGAHFSEDPEFAKKIQKAFKKGRRRVYPRLRRIKRSYKRLKVPTYLTDESQYQFIVSLFKTNRVFPIRGDLTAELSVKDVAKATKECGLVIKTLYLSNAEQYFKYSDQYRENMLALPFDDDSLVIRTAGKRTEWAADGLYEYVIQGGHNFHTWIAHKKTFNVWTIVAARDVNKKTGGSVVTDLPTPVE